MLIGKIGEEGIVEAKLVAGRRSSDQLVGPASQSHDGPKQQREPADEQTPSCEDQIARFRERSAPFAYLVHALVR